MKNTGDGRRVARVEREIQGIIAQYISRGLRTPSAGLITVAKVLMPADLRSAKVFVSVLGAETDQVVEGLQHEASEIQRYIGSQLKMRYCPRLTFMPDHTTEQLLKIERIIDELNPSEQKSEEDVSEDEGSR